jgi:hypothetical protein
MRSLIGLIVASVMACGGVAHADPVIRGHGTVDRHEFDLAQVGWSRYHVQHVFDTEGHRTGMYADEHHRWLKKAYPADNGGVVVVVYRGPLCQCGPFVHPYHLFAKHWKDPS